MLLSFAGLSFGYIGTFLIVLNVIKNIQAKTDILHCRLQVNELKFSNEIIRNLKNDSILLNNSDESNGFLSFGNNNASNVIILISNPVCKACSEIHPYISHLLKGGNFRLAFYLKDFEKSLTDISKYIIAAYLKYGDSFCWNMISDWYTSGYKDGYDFFHKHNLKITTDVKNIYKKQEEWVNKHNIDSTPSIFINGIPIKTPFTIFDIPYLLEKS